MLVAAASVPQRSDSAFVCGTWPHSQPVTSNTPRPPEKFQRDCALTWGRVSLRLCTHLLLEMNTSFSLSWILIDKQKRFCPTCLPEGSGPMCQ